VNAPRSRQIERSRRFLANRRNDMGPGDAVTVNATGEAGSVLERVSVNRALVLLPDGREVTFYVESLRLA
jgi:hypothetical protein